MRAVTRKSRPASLQGSFQSAVWLHWHGSDSRSISSRLEDRDLVEAEILIDVAGHLLDDLGVTHVLFQARQLAENRGDRRQLSGGQVDVCPIAQAVWEVSSRGRYYSGVGCDSGLVTHAK